MSLSTPTYRIARVSVDVATTAPLPAPTPKTPRQTTKDRRNGGLQLSSPATLNPEALLPLGKPSGTKEAKLKTSQTHPRKKNIPK